VFICGFYFFSLCVASNAQAQATTQPFRIVGRIDSPAIPESSGVVESRRHAGVYWTLNDSGNAPAIFAIDRSGKLLGMFAVNAPNVDWEDIAIDDAGFIYLADIGNNTAARNEVQVYRVAEPDPLAKGNGPLAVDRTWRLTYPAKPFDAESLALLGDSGYVIAKYRDATLPGIYRFSLTDPAQVQPLKQVATLSLRSPVTAADISSDGQQLAVMTVTGPAVYPIAGDIQNIAKPPIASIFFIDPVIEGICFTKGGLLATTEGRRVVFFALPAAATQPASRAAE
jgi:hypothetical protein